MKEKLEADVGDELLLDEVIKQKLIEKGKKSTCKIILSDNENSIIKGSGFFCKIPYFGKKMKVLLTNNHILNKESIKKGNEIKLSYQNKLKILEITEERNCWTSLTYDFTCIEILNKDNIEDFFEIENENKNNYNGDEIAVIQYPEGGPMKIYGGHLYEINNDTIIHSAKTNKGSSGSPIILLLRDFKIIGIHHSFSEDINLI